ncbi:MAG: hypothetical protein GPJ50_03885 [Candidatus Heimdallarchaeota archaeon]|nr:hypothetical protein [Candidatus Heimdallarchaeota archaeon]
MEKQHRELSFSLDITRKIGKNKWTLYVTKDANLSGVFIIEAGEAKPFTLEQAPEEEPSEPSEPLEPTEDFDDVATKIEATQDLQEEDEETSKNNIS